MPSIGTIIAFAAGLCLLYLLGRVLSAPLKWILRLLMSAALGGLALFFIERMGGIFGVTVALNPATALISGVLGLPGIVLMLVVQAMI